VGRAFTAFVLAAVCLLAVPFGGAQVMAQVPAAASPAPAAPSAQATQPFTGFVSSYEIAKIARSAGFDPLAPPLREGTTYVLRATDYRGILMRVVIDARTGAIRDANRIVPGPGRYGEFVPPYEPAGLGAPPPGMGPTEAEMEPPPVVHASTHPGLSVLPPLPRPRPATLASRKPLDDANQAANPTAKPQPAPEHTATTPAPPPAAKPQINSEVITAAPPSAPRKTPAVVEPLND
jgi:hypothetical protein